MTETVQGECLHGKPIRWFGNSVVFSKSCPPCEAKLRSEGFDVSLAPSVAA